MKQPILQLQLDGVESIIDIHKVTGVRVDMPTILTIERISNGENRLTYNQIQIPDLTKIKGIIFLRQAQDGSQA